MNVETEQVFIVNVSELDQQIATPLQRAFTIAGSSLQTEEAQTNMCLQQSMNIPSRTQMCRLCAAVTEMVVPIFHGEGLQNNLADKIHQHLPIRVSEDDLLPVVICFQCTSTLLAWHELVVCSIQADAVMRKRFNMSYSQQQQQPPPDAQSSQDQIKDEKCTAREARACVRCEHCAGYFPDTHLRAHLLTAHAPRLFLCAECDLYRNRGDLLAHMATHIEKPKDPHTRETSSSPETKQFASKTIIPVVRIQRLPKLSAPPPLVKSSAVTSSRSSIPLANNSSNSSPVAVLRSVSLEPPPLRKIKPKLGTKNVFNNEKKKETCNEKNVSKESANEIIPTEHQTASDGKLSKVEHTYTPGRNEFSDHSDTENEFGRLPESVFDAIEDSQDGNDSRDTQNTVENTKKPNFPRACPECEKLCNTLSGWYYHLKHAHGSRKKIFCDKCHKVFTTKSELATHIRTHTKEKPFQCRICPNKFGSRAGRYIHEQTHSPRRVHVCGRCPRAFRWRAQLKRHEARHDSNKSHVCTQCGRGFSVASDLLRHVRAHTPGRHRCDICNATFKQKRYLKVHLENIHLAKMSTPLDKKTSKKTKKLVSKQSDKNTHFPSEGS